MRTSGKRNYGTSFPHLNPVTYSGKNGRRDEDFFWSPNFPASDATKEGGRRAVLSPRGTFAENLRAFCPDQGQSGDLSGGERHAGWGPGTPVQTLTRHHGAVFYLPAASNSFLSCASPQSSLASRVCNWTFQAYQRAGQTFVFYGLRVYL